IQRSSAGALGPFQILPGTARKDLKMHVTNRADDERAFFAPSACGGAEYLRRMVDNFRGEGKDSTVAILAYYQGPAGASAAIVCSQEKDLSARRTCALQIDPNDVREHNKRAKNKLARYNQGEFNYFYRHAKNYQYAYADLESLGYLPGHMSNYVNKKLAVYFVASHMRDYGFEISSNKRTTLPDNAKPSRPINDEKCRRIAAELLR
ncbi:MAG: lytic transglycosylase domain-containing protein, partial [Bdellovibrionales bacterium]